jgi:hypothetical protein
LALAGPPQRCWTIHRRSRSSPKAGQVPLTAIGSASRHPGWMGALTQGQGPGRANPVAQGTCPASSWGPWRTSCPAINLPSPQSFFFPSVTRLRFKVPNFGPFGSHSKLASRPEKLVSLWLLGDGLLFEQQRPRKGLPAQFKMPLEELIIRGADLPGSTDLQFGLPNPQLARVAFQESEPYPCGHTVQGDR